MQGSTKRIARTAFMALVAFSFHQASVVAGNSLVLRKSADNSIVIELSNCDGIAGAQFSITSRGGVVLRMFEPSERLTTAGITVYQAFAGDSTLNIVLLASARSTLPCGSGAIGKIGFNVVAGIVAESAQVNLHNVVFCDLSAKSLEVSTADASWQIYRSPESAQTHVLMEQNFPNPFNPSTTIRYRLGNAGQVRLAIFDIAGRMVNLLVDGQQGAGQHSVRWSLDGGARSKLASGLYVARLTVDGTVSTMKMILTK